MFCRALAFCDETKKISLSLPAEQKDTTGNGERSTYMMISQKMVKSLNEQVKNEFFAEWTYLSMAYQFESMNLKIFAKWFFLQAAEEHEHAMKIAKYIVDQGGVVHLQQLPAPKLKWKSALEICDDAVKHEKNVTQMIDKLMEQAKAEKDNATQVFLHWFVKEQVEEVASTTELRDMVALTQSEGQVLMLEGRIWRMVEEREKEED
jgi:ferritin